jgi:mono/diheme cytochrome c family protein
LADAHVLYQRRQVERRRYPGGDRIHTQRARHRRADPGSAGPAQPARPGDAGRGPSPSGKPVITGSITAPPKGATFQFGEYILSYQDCRQCHGPRLTGGVPGQIGPLGPDLNLVRDWKLAEFITTMRTGIDPNGRELSGQMPWRPIGRMDDEELAAVYEYLTHLPDS